MKHSTQPALHNTDKDIITFIKNGDEKGYSLIYMQYWRHLVAYARSIVKEQHVAEEIVQGIIVNLFIKRVIIQSETNILPYLHKAIRNRVINHYRDRYNYIKYKSYKIEGDTVNTDVIMKSLYQQDIRKELNRCLLQMPKKHAEVFLLNKEYMFRLKEISRQLDRPVATIEKQLRKALLYLKENINAALFREN